MFSFIAVSCLIVAATAAPYGAAIGAISTIDSVSVPRYNFNYAVNDPVTGDNKQQSETREGGYVKGSYSLAEPDGTIRIVDYTADPVSGFNAVVRRVGHASHPQVIRPVVTQVATPVVEQIATPVVSQIAHAPIATPAVATSQIGYENVGYSNLGYDNYLGGNLGYNAGYSGYDLGYSGHGSWNLGHGSSFGHGYYRR
ncbi:cuticle protein 7-like [Pieris rapae]|uniref:cuticle protein 7-like n=1 Tax=Pieris rapae TaxID=64459 RepID=UPI001E27FF07|nr:cuticle protein 7-like [Pieris rapae]